MSEYEISNIVETKRNGFPVSVINESANTYTGDGKTKMDKSEKDCYIKNNLELTVENVFGGDTSIKDIIKAIILEKKYNSSNKIVTASKEVIQ